jgi:protein-L-isoaspartate(D-aspartate) O-methyltransferase
VRRFPAIILIGAVVALACCSVSCATSADDAAERPVGADAYAVQRDAMVERQIRERGVTDPLVLQAMRAVPRHLFVPEEIRGYAYYDQPLPIGYEQTISQPFIVALMTELAGLEGWESVLEIGTGSGYQAAVLGEIVATVYTIEIVEPLADRARATLEGLGYENVHVKYGDGYRGWPEHAPFDAVIVTAAPEEVPEPLLEQLAVGGRLVIPVGGAYQELVQITKTEDGAIAREIIPVRFVPMTGEAQERARDGE